MRAFWKGKRVLVTGSEGLIGRPVCRLLQEHGAEAWHFDLETGNDILDFGMVRRCIEDKDIIIHLAAISNVPKSRGIPRSAFEVIAQGTVNVLEAARLYEKCEAIVTASSNHVYGQQEVYPTPEGAPLRNLDPYSVAKVCADYMARSYMEVFRLPVVALRNTNCFGPDDPHEDHLVPTIIRALQRGEPIRFRSDGLTPKGYLYVDDVAEAYLAAAELAASGRWGAFNVTGERETPRGMVRRISGIMGTGYHIQFGAHDPLEHHEDLDDSLFRSLTGWKPKHTLDEALAKTIEGFKERMAIPS